MWKKGESVHTFVFWNNISSICKPVTNLVRVQKIQCPLVWGKLFCLWDKCEFMFSRPEDKKTFRTIPPHIFLQGQDSDITHLFFQFFPAAQRATTTKDSIARWLNIVHLNIFSLHRFFTTNQHSNKNQFKIPVPERGFFDRSVKRLWFFGLRRFGMIDCIMSCTFLKWPSHP